MNQQTNGDNGASQTPCTCGPNMQMQGCHGVNCPWFRNVHNGQDQYRGLGSYQGLGTVNSDAWQAGYDAGYQAGLRAAQQGQGQGAFWQIPQRGQWCQAPGSQGVSAA